MLKQGEGGIAVLRGTWEVSRSGVGDAARLLRAVLMGDHALCVAFVALGLLLIPLPVGCGTAPTRFCYTLLEKCLVILIVMTDQMSRLL